MTAVSTGPRQDIIDALLERGYIVLEVVWVADVSLFNPVATGFWAATYRNPTTRAAGSVTGRYLGVILKCIDALPDLTQAGE